MKSTFYFAQDTAVNLAPDSVSGLKKFSSSQVDDVFKAMERKEREMDSIARVRAYRAYLRSLKEKQPEGFDTSAVPYNFDLESFDDNQNPLKNLKDSYYSAKDTSKPVFHESVSKDSSAFLTEITPTAQAPEAYTHNLRPDWLLGIIIASLVLLAWLKLFYNRFLDQTIQSLTNYQLSTKLLRDQNMFSRRVAFTLNINFILIGAAFVYLILGYLKISLFHLSDILSYLVYAGILTGFLVLRYIASHLIGYIFNKHSEFREYLHQLLLIHKSLGVYLLIPVIGIAYVGDDLRVYLIYLSALMALAAVVLRIGKGLKIILNNKDVLIFYLILYLCTLEILPLLLFCRFFSSSVTAG